jgi:hypothetical protein
MIKSLVAAVALTIGLAGYGSLRKGRLVTASIIVITLGWTCLLTFSRGHLLTSAGAVCLRSAGCGS